MNLKDQRSEQCCNQREEEHASRLQERIDELELELEFERSSRLDAQSFASSMKRYRQQRSEEAEDALLELNRQNSVLKEKVEEYEKIEQELRSKLGKQSHEIHQLESVIDEQDKKIVKLEGAVKVMGQPASIKAGKLSDILGSAKTIIRTTDASTKSKERTNVSFVAPGA